MMDETALLNSVKECLREIDQTEVNRNVFRKLGVQVVRRAVDPDVVSSWFSLWTSTRSGTTSVRQIENPSNPVEVKDLPSGLDELVFDERLVRHAVEIFGPDVGLFHNRFVVKDAAAAGAIMLHQDSGYHTGSLEKASFFLALNPVSVHNGAMFFYPGTHRFGFLGDAGEINPEVLPDDWPVVTPALQRGDLMIMDSRIWHGSHQFVSGPDRVMTDFIYQRADDPSSIAVVAGKGWEPSFLSHRRADIFINSRSRKLHSIRAVLDSTTN